jgi:hypothetical protein
MEKYKLGYCGVYVKSSIMDESVTRMNKTPYKVDGQLIPT